MELRNSGTLVSVIVPVHNTRRYLERCVDSLMAQSLTDMEIIIVDDCSEEDIQSVVASYIGQSNKVVRFERLKQHKGPGGARNRGIELASGTYIAFCDSDDWVDITYFEDCSIIMNRTGADIGMCSLVRVYDHMQNEPLYKCRYDRELTLTGDFALKALTKQMDIGVLVIPSTVNKIYRREYLSQIHLRFVEGRLFEDLLFSFISIMNAEKIICIPNTTYHHYKRPNSIVQSFDIKHIDDFVEIFTLLRQHLKDDGRYEPYRFHYYKFLEQFYNLIVREIFEFVLDEKSRKAYLADSFLKIKSVIDFEEYMEYTTAEQLRQHIQPHITDTTIY